MAHILIMPRQGNTVESCIICEWKVKEGDSVKEDTPVCSVETDKASFEIPAGAAGTVLKLLYESGDDVPVLEPIMVIGNPSEDWQAAIPQGSSHSNMPSKEGTAQREEIKEDTSIVPPLGTSAPLRENTSGGVSPRARNLAEKEAIPLNAVSGSGPDGRIIEQDIAAYAANRPPLTNAAKDELRKRMEAGHTGHVEGGGSGLAGRITADELENVFTHHITAPQASGLRHSVMSIQEVNNIADNFSDTPIKGIRKIIAEQMMKSSSTTATFTLNSSAPAVKLQELRQGFKNSPEEFGLNKITINDLVLFAVSRVLTHYHYMNVHKIGDTIRHWNNIHLGVAVSTGRGLMVPVIRNADKLSLLQISQRARELAGACRCGTISPDDLKGSTFTISNLGNAGIESFSPVINIPEAAILGVCSIVPKPVESCCGEYKMLPHIGFSLTIDHAVVDGAPAAEFLKTLCDAIRDINMWIIRECM